MGKRQKRQRIDLNRPLEEIFPTPPTRQQLSKFFRQAAAQYLEQHPEIVQGIIAGKDTDAIMRDLGLSERTSPGAYSLR
jgi:hypothetical protein